MSEMRGNKYDKLHVKWRVYKKPFLKESKPKLKTLQDPYKRNINIFFHKKNINMNKTLSHIYLKTNIICFINILFIYQSEHFIKAFENKNNEQMQYNIKVCKI